MNKVLKFVPSYKIREFRKFATLLSFQLSGTNWASVCEKTAKSLSWKSILLEASCSCCGQRRGGWSQSTLASRAVYSSESGGQSPPIDCWSPHWRHQINNSAPSKAQD